ncbi:hypothetical protein HDK90DRAFT_188196 [Phyllosticta capitalensis]|uniref:Secreted protein n=1 Tax=Phyllosticta capitalensis TaxID=121624 RepID=A0ABR1YWK6_9PEZI
MWEKGLRVVCLVVDLPLPGFCHIVIPHVTSVMGSLMLFRVACCRGMVLCVGRCLEVNWHLTIDVMSARHGAQMQIIS